MGRPVQQTLQGGTSTFQDGSQADPATGKAGLISLGGILAALGAGACCVVPFALVTLGISGAWIANLTALAPYKPIFAAVALGFIGFSAYRVYRKPKAECAAGSYCADPRSDRLAKIGLWTAASLLITAVAFPYVARAFLGS